MRKALDMLYRISGGLAALSLLSIALIVFTQVLFNLIDFAGDRLFGGGPGWLIPSYAQLAGYALAFTTFLSLGLGFRRAAHIRVTLIESRLPRALRRPGLTVIAAIGAGLAALMVWSFGHLVWESWQWDDRATGLLRTPLWVPQSVMLAGLIVMLIAALDTLVEMILFGQSEALIDDTHLEDAHNE